jgi:hypothetical protein
MTWKRAGGREYLFRLRGRHGNGKSLGPRNAENEARYREFHRRKDELKTRFSSLRERLKEQSRFARAARLGVLGRQSAAVLRELDRRRFFDAGLEVAGTHALHAYEALAGVSVARDLLATDDLDLLWDDRVRLRATQEVRRDGVMGALKAVDKSFEARRHRDFRAVNKEGFYVDIIRPEFRREGLRSRPDAIGEGDLEAAPIASQRRVVNARTVRAAVIASDGYPVYLVAPDPRVFALHKLFISERADRDPVKRGRDRSQAELVAELVLRYLPDRPFERKALQMLPRRLRGDRGEIMPDGFDL